MNHNGLAFVVAIHVVGAVEAIAAAAPAEVEVHEVVVVVAVAHEGVAAVVVGTGIVDGVGAVEFGLQHVNPRVFLVAALADVFGATVAEISA